MISVLHRAVFTIGLAGLVGAVVGLGGCTRDKVAKEGRVSQMQVDQYKRDATRKSSEGVLLEPSMNGLGQIERTRLNEIAQELRQPGAVCFLERAIKTMEQGEADGEQVWIGVPEGQAKFRVRVAVDGTVLTTDLLESGFVDKHMETCVAEGLTKQRFVESRDSFAYFVDVYYWVSLGMFADAQTEQFAALMRRQQAEAGLRARACLTGRVPAGEYVVTGLNLFDRDGRTVVNRVDRAAGSGELSDEISSCIATAFKQIKIHGEPDSFVRPAAPRVVFTVAGDGTVAMADERWLEMVTLEEQAEREMKRAELLRAAGEAEATVDGEVPKDLTDMDPELDPTTDPGPGPVKPVPAPSTTPSTTPKPAPTGDPTQPGTKLDLSPRGRSSQP